MRSLWTKALLVALCAPTAAWADATVKLLKSPVSAGEIARVRVHVSEPLKAPLHAVSSVGAISPFAEVAPDTYEADFAPPAKGSGPALAEIVVFEDRSGGALASTLVNIADTVTASVKVKTREAVYVRGSGERVGPLHADAKGVVTATFVANGELTEARVESAQGKPIATLPLRPGAAKSVAIGRPTRFHAGDTRPLEVLFLTREGGKVEAPRATASAGKIALDGLTDSGFRYTLVPPPTLAAPLTVKLEGPRGAPLGQVAFTTAGPAIAKITLAPPAKPLKPGDRATINVALSAANGGEADGEIVVEADSGTVQPPLALGPGVFTVTYVAPSQVPAGGVVHLRAKVIGEDVAPATGELKLRGGKAAKVVFHVPPAPPRPGDEVQVQADVLDASGNPTDGESLEVGLDHGEVSRVVDQGGGHFLVAVRTPDDAQALTLTAKDHGAALEGTQKLSLQPIAAMPFALLGPEAGFGSNLGSVSTVNVALAAHFLVGPQSTVPARGTVGFLVGYLPESTTTLQSDTKTAAGTLQLSRIALLARGGGFYALGDVGLFGGAALGVMNLSGTFRSPGRTDLPLSSWHPAAGLYGGAGYHLGPGMIALEVRGTYSSIDLQNDAVRVTGGIGGIDGALGYLVEL